MRRTGTRVLLLAAAVAAMAVLAAPALQAQTGNIDPTQQYAWGENAGWFDLRPASSGGVTVYSTWLTGYAWQENVGWVKFGADAEGPYVNDSATNWGVNLNSVTGALSGWAWSENAGWISMNPTYGGVELNSTTHQMGGYAWSENLGWIHFWRTASPAYGVATTCDPGAPFSLAASKVTGFCGVRLSWIASASLCTQPVTYMIYRSTSSGFTPAAGNRIASCVTGTTYDDDVASETYYYRVQTEDGSPGSTGTTCNGGLVSSFSSEVTGTSTCSSPPQPFRVFSATSTNASVLLQWLNPTSCTAFVPAISYATAGYPAAHGDPTAVTVGQQNLCTTSKGSVSTSLSNDLTYRFSAFVKGSSDASWSARKTTWARPFDSAGNVKWAYTTGASAMVQPGNNQATGASSVLFVSNDRVLHSAVSGTTGGQWPSGFVPQAMNAPSQAWPGVVPGMSAIVTGGADRVAFIPSQDGYLYARNVATGASIWSTALLGDALQGGVAGIFERFGGPSGVNRLFVGSRNATDYNKIYGIEAASGGKPTDASGWPFDNGASTTAANAIGIISSMPAVDYSSSKVYVTSRQKTGGTTQTLWCLTYEGIVCTGGWASLALGDIDSSPNVRSGYVYVGTNAGLVYKIDATSGVTSWTSSATSDGPVRVGLWVDLTVDRVYFSTNTKVWALVASTGALVSGNDIVWPVAIESPSYPVKVNGKLYVGSSDGELYQVDGTTGVVDMSVTLGNGKAAVGTPAYNGLDQMLYVGTEAGVVYAVQVPLTSS